MTKTIAAIALASGLLGGCFFVSKHPRGQGRAACGPAHHWDNGSCVHNGNGEGNGNGKGKGNK